MEACQSHQHYWLSSFHHCNNPLSTQHVVRQKPEEEARLINILRFVIIINFEQLLLFLQCWRVRTSALSRYTSVHSTVVTDWNHQQSSHWNLKCPQLWQYVQPILSAVRHSYCIAGSTLTHVVNNILSFQNGEFFRLSLSPETMPHILQHFLMLLQFKTTNADNFY